MAEKNAIISYYGESCYNRYRSLYNSKLTRRCKTLASMLKNKYGINRIRELKWSGEVHVAYDYCIEEGASAMKMHNCDIYVRCMDVTDDILIHELLHSASASHCLEKYPDNKHIEEGIVEMFAKEIAKKEHFETTSSGYAYMVAHLIALNAKLKLYPNPYAFARHYFRVDMDKRLDKLQNDVASKIKSMKKVGYSAEIEETIESVKYFYDTFITADI